jgi:predicted dehydrogenase
MSNLLKWRNDPNKLAYSYHKSKGGGVLMDFIHEPDYVFSCFGLPKNVRTFQRRLFQDVTVDSDDSCVMLWEYEKTLVTFCLSYSSSDYVRNAEVLKEDASSVRLDITREDIEVSYEKQWLDVLNNGPRNSYLDCLELYSKLNEENLT